jgi:uncharacterized Zn-finger protein
VYGQPNQYLLKGKHGINTPQQNELILVLVNHRKISLKMVKKKKKKICIWCGRIYTWKEI